MGKPKTKLEKKQQRGKVAQGDSEEALPSTGAMQIPIGTVHMVDQSGRFILIKTARRTALEQEAEIYTYGKNAQVTSTLKASTARKGAFLTADMVDGTPNVGDTVMIVHTIKPPKKSGDTGKLGDISSNSNVQVLE